MPKMYSDIEHLKAQMSPGLKTEDPDLDGDMGGDLDSLLIKLLVRRLRQQKAGGNIASEERDEAEIAKREAASLSGRDKRIPNTMSLADLTRGPRSPMETDVRKEHKALFGPGAWMPQEHQFSFPLGKSASSRALDLRPKAKDWGKDIELPMEPKKKK